MIFDLNAIILLLKKADELDVKITFANDKLSVKVNRERKPDPIFLDEIKASKPQLIEYFKTNAQRLNRNVLPSISRRTDDLRIPLSFAQERLWFADGLHGSTEYNMLWMFGLKGRLDIMALEKSFKEIIRRHEVLRTVIREDEGLGYQLVMNGDEWKMQLVEGSTAGIASNEDAVAFIESLVHEPIDLSNDSVFRVSLIRLSEDEHILAGIVHHIAFDGWSQSIIVKELTELYSSYTEKRPAVLETLAVQYADYSVWQRTNLSGELLQHKLDYWKEQLRGVEPLGMITDYNRPARQSLRASSVSKLVGVDTSALLNRLSQREGVTLFMTLLAAFKVLLYRYSGQRDLCVGTPVAGRQQQETEGLVGFFINTLALRSQLEGGMRFTDLLQQVKGMLLDAYERQEVPFEQIVEVLGTERDMSRSPVFQAVFALHNTPDTGTLRLGEVELTPKRPQQQIVLFDLDLDVMESAEGIHLSLKYCIDLYREDTASLLLEHYEQLLQGIATTPELSLDDVVMLLPRERQLLDRFNATTFPYPSGRSVIDLFEEQTLATPDAVALLFGTEQWSYGELDKRSSKLAHYLVSKGACEGQFIALCMERSRDLIISILAILKTGAAYVPIDPDYPEQRIVYMLEDCGASLLLSISSLVLPLSSPVGVTRIDIDTESENVTLLPDTRLPVVINPLTLAYLMYTSGSTGIPKGVKVTHLNIVSLVKEAGFLSFGCEDVLLSTGSPSFDATTIEYWGTLLNGAKLVMCSQETLLDITALKTIIQQEGVTTMWFTAGWFNQLVETDITIFSTLTTVLAGGDRLSPSHVGELQARYPDLVLINGYGPTENTTFSLTHRIERLRAGTEIPIGRPLHNRSAYVLDSNERLCPVGVRGELYVGGAGLSAGYHNRPELTEEKFREIPGLGKLYRTGDMARWTNNGVVEFLGRLDDQVKIRGFRVEPGEVANAIQELEGVGQAVVLVHEEEGNKRLVGYIVKEKNGTDAFDGEEVRMRLKQRLPEYMVPSVIIEVAGIPLTSNGKVDGKALLEAFVLPSLQKEYEGARNGIEELLVNIWQDLLGVERVGIHDDFFELGGHSLLAIRLLSVIRAETGREIAIRNVFEHPTIAMLGERIAAATINNKLLAPIRPCDRTSPLALSYGQERLWFIDRLQGSVHYHMPWVFRLKGRLDVPVLEASFKEVINRHEILRTVIKESDGVGYQEILSAAAWKLEYMQSEDIAGDYESLGAYLHAYTQKAYDLSSDYMLRAGLIRLSDEEYILMGMVHHIAFDGWSIGILVKELTSVYKRLQGQEQYVSEALPIQYADYAAWQREYLSGEVLQNKLLYWKGQLKDVEPLALQTDRPRSAEPTISGGVVSRVVSSTYRDDLMELSQKRGVTLFMTLLSVFKVLLYRYTGQGDICVGTSVAGRQQKELDGLIGFFVNSLVLRSEVRGAEHFASLLERVKQTTLDGYGHQEAPFEKIVEVMGIQPDRNRNPLFQVLFTLQNTPESAELDFAGVQLTAEPMGRETSQFDLNLDIIESDEGLYLNLVYKKDIYDEASAVRMLGHYEELLMSVLKNSEQAVDVLNMLGIEEQQQLEVFSCGPKVSYEDTTVVALIDRQGMQNPDAIALVSSAGEMNYGELMRQSNLLVHRLLAKGVKRGDMVGICLENGQNMLLAILGVLKAGAAYVPLDPAYPPDRIAYMLRDCDARLVVSNLETMSILPAGTALLLVDVEETVKTATGVLSLADICASDLAYIIYTSGSTGLPKGVMITHGSLIHYLYWAQEQYMNKTRTAGGSGSYAHLSFTFDASLSALFVPLISGRMLTMSSRTGAGVFEDRLLKEHAPYDFIKLTPAHLPLLEELMGAEGVAELTSTLVVGGEALQPGHIAYLGNSADVRIINEYGPTEATVGCCNYSFAGNAELPSTGSGGILIGKPIGGVWLYILDGNKKETGIGIAGEIFIGGDQLARGYLNRQELTEEKFVEVAHLGRLYATGDRGRWLADGNIEFLGRLDEQVKIRGYRIEPGEVERVLEQITGVARAVVLVQQEEGTDKKLVGYIVAEKTEDAAYNREWVMEQVRQKLPEYMVPSALVEVDEIPLTINGKVDKRKLMESYEGLPSQQEYIAPRNATEEVLVNIWQHLLEVDRVGAADDFFSLGGHSLLAIRLVAAIRAEFGCELAIRDIFEHPTIALLSEHMSVMDSKVLLPKIVASDRQDGDIIPLSFSQERLWFIDRLQGSVQYHMPWVFRLKGVVNRTILEASFKEIVKRHEVLRTVVKETDGVGYQQVRDAEGWKMEWLGTEEVSVIGMENLEDYIQGFIKQPYDLSADYMLKVVLIQLSAEEYLLLAMVHHIAFDGWSISIMVRELTALYMSGQLNKPASLKKLAIQYADYASWQRQYLTGDILQGKMSYWKAQLKDTEPLSLMTDYPRPAIQTIRGGAVHRLMDPACHERLLSLSQREGVTLYMTLLACFKVLLYRYTGQQDICVGTPVAGRQQQETEDLIGFFINTLAIRSRLGGDLNFSDLLRQLKQTTLSAYEHQDVPFEKIVEALGVQRDMSRNPIFQIMFVLQNTPSSGSLDLGGATLEEEALRHITSTFDLSLTIETSEQGMQLSITYCADLFENDTMDRMLGHYCNLLETVVIPGEKSVGKMAMLDKAEISRVINEFNNTDVIFQRGKTLCDLFEELVQVCPDDIALVFEEEELSYRQLNEKANRLAHYLREAGLKEEMLAAICIDKSIDMVVSIFAVLKAGGAYMPIDPLYPAERIRFMLSDSDCSHIITTTAFGELINDTNQEGIIICLDELKDRLTDFSDRNLTGTCTENSLAYVIYTSGSTGNPKGVMIEHRSVVNLIFNQVEPLGLHRGMPVFQFASFSFDACCHEIFCTLLHGGCLILSQQETLLNPTAFAALLSKHKVELVTLPPSYQSIITEHDFSLRTIISAGEKMNSSLAAAIGKKGIRMINAYGPTENTVSSILTASPVHPNGQVVIGKPLPNVRAYILDAALNPVPVGAMGELYLGGAQVARGYINRPDLTAEKFIMDPFHSEKGNRMYRTGDMARWLPDGNVEYLDRIDNQVKVRGYRIELGEIEAVLHSAPGIIQAAVIVQEDKQGHKRLTAYATGNTAFDKDTVTAYLKTRLPEYMVPTVLVNMDNLPLLPNGKVNRKALADITSVITVAYEAPRNEAEQDMATIWQDLLGVESVGIYDNFFELGGDSIITIQVISRAKRKGIQLTPRDLFHHQTIAALSSWIEKRGALATSSAEQGMLTGESGLLPIQQWYFESEPSQVSHFNQAVLLGIGKEIEAPRVQEAMDRLISHHDALRYVYHKEDNGWKQSYGSFLPKLELLDLSAASEDEFAVLMSQHNDVYQQRLDIEKGILVCIVLIQTPASQERNRLLFIVHHLAVDGVSWRILLEDFEMLLRSPQSDPGEKTSSYRQWYDTLVQYSKSTALLSQKAYWENSLSRNEPLPHKTDYAGPVLMKDIRNLHLELDTDLTTALLQEAAPAYHTEINDILLAALSMTLAEWTNNRHVLIGLEGHGRDAVTDGVDTSHTAGWFTSMYPFLLQPDRGMSYGDLIKSVKEQLRLVPDKGTGYGVLKFFNREKALQGKDKWEIVFNYLGQTDNVLDRSGLLTDAVESPGIQISPDFIQQHLLSLNSIVSGGKLVQIWSYSGKHYDEASITQLAEIYNRSVATLVQHCREAKSRTQWYTPSDYGLGADISWRELDAFLNESFKGAPRYSQLQAIHRLTGLQQGLLFHSLYDEKGDSYTEQFVFNMSDLDEAAFRQSWNGLILRHSILRTGFYYDRFNIPVQCVYSNVEMPVEMVDLREVNALMKEQVAADYQLADMLKRFEFEEAPLMRVSLLRLDDSCYRMLWTHHHIIGDGWSLQVLMEEFLTLYESLSQGELPDAAAEDNYGDYIGYIEKQSKVKEEGWWKAYMHGFETASLLPFIPSSTDRNRGVETFRAVELHMDAEQTTALQNFARRQKLTVNTVIQGICSYLIYRYSGSQEICFGVTVSGRPEDLAGVEQRVGMYINTLPFHDRVIPDQDISTWLQHIQDGQLRAREFQYSSLNEIQKWTGIQGDLFDVLLTFQNYPVSEVVAARNWKLQVQSAEVHEQTPNYPLTIRVRLGADTLVQFIYKGSVLEEGYVNMIAGHFETVLQQMVSGGVTITSGLRLHSAAEEEQLLRKHNGSPADYPRNKTIVDIAEEQTAKVPGAIAVSCDGMQLTYGELEAASNRLAGYLVQKGLQRGDFAGVCLERSLDMIVAMIGILKAGGAYIPIDPAYPADRISYMIDDSECQWLITNEDCQFNDGISAEVIYLDTEKQLIDSLPATKPSVSIDASDAAYVIYTSGSTGKPKGVIVEHGNVVRLFKSEKPVFDFNESDVWSVYHSFCFDFSVWEMYGALFYGGRMVIISREMARDVISFGQLLVDEKVTVLNQTPGAFYALQEHILNSAVTAGSLALRYIIFGGEALTPSRLKDWISFLPSCKMVNMYGITETTVHVTYKEITEKEAADTTSNIGGPIPTLQCYILNAAMELQPVGVPGELYVGGAGVARGYLNKPALTAERFIQHSFNGNGETRLYKSGDLARWLPDGSIEYLGRGDDQVKIRGYRIELGEVETALQELDGITQAVVVVHQEENSKRLVGYVVAGGNIDSEQIKIQLKQRLPEYMIPSAIMELATIPLTSNGKVDRKKLLESFVSPSAQQSYAAPRNEMEQALADIWQDLLGIDKVGIHDNFFELGGDSIITIQVISRTKRKGYHLTPRDLFFHQTIAALGNVMAGRTGGYHSNAEQGLLEGVSGLLPIQDWYLDSNPVNVSHFNQAVILGVDKSITHIQVQVAAEQLVSHHDALRFAYRKTNSGWEQAYGGQPGKAELLDLSSTTDEQELAQVINQYSDQYQRSLDIEKGDLVRTVLIKTPAFESQNRLLLIIHHLAVDGVSWRIILEDLDLLLGGIVAGDAVSLGAKTNSYRQWRETLVQYGNSKEAESQRPYWQKITGNYHPFVTDKEHGQTVRRNQMHGHTVMLDASLTRSLLQEVPRVYHTEINDILLAALAKTLCNHGKMESVVIGLEGHGRENIADDADTSRTVGWFTSLYPVMLECGEMMAAGEMIKSVKESLRQVPDKGIGYGVLKYLNRDEALRGKQPWDIMFNYLGQLDQVVNKNRWLSEAGEGTGISAYEEQEVDYKLAINAMVQSGSLVISWTYSSVHLENPAIEKLSSDYINNLELLIGHCREQDQQFATPSDYGLEKEISYKELDRFLDETHQGKPRRNLVESIYRLSALQEGLFFHSLYHEQDSAYIEQFSCDLINLDTEAFLNSWNRTLENHSILRTGFYHNAFGIPVQCVYRSVKMPLTISDYRHLDDDAQQKAIEIYQENDKYQPFVFGEAPLMRLSLLRLSDDRYRMLWAYHHIVFDGWSKPLLIEEVLTGYDQLVSGGQLTAVTEDRYEDYIRHIEGRSKVSEQVYWQRYMQGLPEGTMLPFISSLADRNKGVEPYKALELLLDEEQTRLLVNFAQSRHVTVNTVMQGVWALLLHKYTGSNNISYGVTVSGRPDELAGVEQRIGMYINLIPLHSAWDAEEQPSVWLQRIQQDQLLCRQYQYTSLSDVQQYTGLQGELFDTMLTFQNFPVSELISSRQWQLQVASMDSHEQTTNYPLGVRVIQTDVTLVQFIYKSKMLDQSYVEMIRAQFRQALSEMISGGKNCLGDINLVSPEDQVFLDRLNNTTFPYPSHATVVDLFTEQAVQTPEAIALAFEGQQYSYKKLDLQSNQLAHYLMDKGAGTGQFIAVCMDRSADLIVAILAILKTGAAYVPVDPGYPEQRIARMLEDSGASLLLSVSSISLSYWGDVTRIDIDIAEASIVKQPDQTIIATITPSSIAYLMYTSGSTGVPKGVVVSHLNIVSLVKEAGFLNITTEDVLLSTGSPSFDATTIEYWGPLLNGGRLVMCSQDRLLDNISLKGVIVNEGVNMMWFTAGWFNQLVETDISVFATLKTVIAGGDRLSPYHVGMLQRSYPELIIINGYGPTENTTFSLTHCITAKNVTGEIPIGQPLNNRTAYVLDGSERLCAVGVRGELYVGGAGLSAGYHKQPELTAEKFREVPGLGRLYRTGDMAMWNTDGTVAFLGRADDQVKIRGYRIELGEIENVLQAIAGISQAVVLVQQEEGEANKRLVGYVVSEALTDTDAMLDELREKLPDYMVPSVLMIVPEIPLTSNGKVDRRALLEGFELPLSQQEYVAPRNAMEEVLAAIWQDLLGVERVSIHDDFFELGGHSLFAIRLLSAIRAEIGREVAIRDVFEYPTIATFSERIASGGGSDKLLAHIKPCDRTVPLVLSYGQERLWFIDRLQGSIQYHIPWVFRLKGVLDVNILEASIQEIINRHEILRTVIHEIDGVGYQRVTAPDSWHLQHISEEQALELYDNLDGYIEALVQQPFDLSSDSMVKVTLIRMTNGDHVLAGVAHHIVFDAWSTGILVDELVTLYASGKEDLSSVLPPMEIQYADYAAWQRQYLSGPLLDSKLAYWKEQLNGVEPIGLLTDFPRPAEQGIKGGVVSKLMDKDLYDDLVGISNKEGTTMFMLLMSMFKVLLYQYTGQSDICVGSSIARRQQQEVEGLIGFFVNTLALRDEVNGDMPFRTLLQQVKQTILTAFEHQDLPFEKVVEALGVERELGRNPVFQVMFVMENTPESADLELGDIQFSSEGFGEMITKFDLTLSVQQLPDGLQFQLLYRTDLYKDETMLRMLTHYENILKTLSKDINRIIGSCSMLTKAEEQQLLVTFGENKQVSHGDKTVLDLFAAQVAETPDHIAVVFRDEQFSYEELDQRSNQLGHYLISCGVKNNHLVPICMERGSEMIVSILAIMKAGAAYIPVDTDYPEERMRYMLEDISPSVIIAGKGKGKKVIAVADNSTSLGDVLIVDMEYDLPLIACAPKTAVNSKVAASDLAYVLYTSGSTGKSKGVMIEHRNLVDYFYGLQDRVAIRECKSFALVSTLSADLGNTVIYGALLSGGTLHVCSQAVINDAGMMLDYCRSQSIDCLKIVPSHWKALCMDDELLLPSKLLIFGGELLRGSLIKDIKATGTTCKVINHYGPTETTIGKLLHEVDLSADYNNSVPIGRPFSNTKIFIINKQQSLCPAGIAGEICIAGEGVARGYMGQADLTKAKFIENPFGIVPGERLYKTGDIGRWLPNGHIEYIGRVDDQVKIRGYRIELGEIESALMAAPGVKQAAVIAKVEENGDKRLAGYIVSDSFFNKETVLTYLREKLPDYMVPPVLIELETMPLNANGKVDRKKLSEKNLEASFSSSKSYAGPRNPMEEVMVEIWQDLLGVERVGIHDNFFELGGDSIITIQVASRARRLGYELQLGDLFENQTIASLSRSLADREYAIGNKAEQGVLTGSCGLLPIQQWYLESDLAVASHYNQSVLLGIDKSVSASQLQSAMEQLVRHHDALRFVYSKTEQGWEQEYGNQLGKLEQLSLEDISEEDLPLAIEQHNNVYQGSLDIEKGDLVRLVLIKTPASQSHNRLLFIVHHLAVDGVSWRILLEDLELLLTGIKFNAPASLGSKTSSYREWYQALVQYGQQEQVQAQKVYWEEILTAYQPLPFGKTGVEDRVAFRNLSNYTVSLDAALTHSLLQEISKKYHTEINDVLLSALAGTIFRFASLEKIVIGLEGHGREAMEGTDTSHTAGWFTNKYPLLLTCDPEMDLSALLKNTKEQLRKVPGKGMGYAVLKYIEGVETLNSNPGWDIVFNYLGQFDNVVGTGKLLTPAAESTGMTIAEDNPAGFRISVNSMVQGGTLILSWSYSNLHFDEGTIAALATQYINELEALIRHCLDQEDQVFTPSDYGLAADISYSELDNFLSNKTKNTEADDIMIF